MRKPKRHDVFGPLMHIMGLRGIGIEIGVAEGKFSEIILNTSPLRKLYLLDIWKEFSMDEYTDGNNAAQAEQDRRYQLVLNKMQQYGERVSVLREDSRKSFKQFHDGFFDFIYIDANHSYEGVKIDIENWYPKCKSGGIFAGHDYVDTVGGRKKFPCGVKQAVHELRDEIGAALLITGGTYRCPSSWYFIKP